jgi:hypothetical protein
VRSTLEVEAARSAVGSPAEDRVFP